MSIEMQAQIKNNSTDVSSYFQDIYKWTENQDKQESRRNRRKEMGLPGAPPANLSAEAKAKLAAAMPPPRASAPIERSDKEKAEEKADKTAKRDKTPMNHFYNDWDRFDVDGEVEKIEDAAWQENRDATVAREAMEDQILNEMALSPEGERKRTTKARPRVKITVRQNGRRPAPIDLAGPRKEEANRYYAEGRYREAILTYSTALESLDKYEPPGSMWDTHGGKPFDKDESENPKDAGASAGDCTGQDTEAIALKVALFANRAQALLKLEEWRDAADDCTEALRFEPQHHKAILRRGFAYARMRRWAPATRDLTKAVANDPADKKAAAELKMTSRMLDDCLNDARVHSKRMMCDSTRSLTMPTRRLTVKVHRTGASADADANTPNARSVAAKQAEKQAAEENGTVSPSAARNEPSATATPNAEGEGVPAAAAEQAKPAERKPYVPRSVRMRGRQPATGVRQPDAAAAPSSVHSGGGVGSSSGSTTSATAPPMNFYTFEAQWVRHRKSPQERAALLRKVGSRALPALLRESLDADLVGQIVEVLESGLDRESSEGSGGSKNSFAGFAGEVMQALSRTARFDLSLRGLSVGERQVCDQVLSKVEAACEELDVDSLRQAFEPPAPPPREPEEYDEDDVAEMGVSPAPVDDEDDVADVSSTRADCVASSAEAADVAGTDDGAAGAADADFSAAAAPSGAFDLDGCD